MDKVEDKVGFCAIMRLPRTSSRIAPLNLPFRKLLIINMRTLRFMGSIAAFRSSALTDRPAQRSAPALRAMRCEYAPGTHRLHPVTPDTVSRVIHRGLRGAFACSPRPRLSNSGNRIRGNGAQSACLRGASAAQGLGIRGWWRAEQALEALERRRGPQAARRQEVSCQRARRAPWPSGHPARRLEPKPSVHR